MPIAELQRRLGGEAWADGVHRSKKSLRFTQIYSDLVRFTQIHSCSVRFQAAAFVASAFSNGGGVRISERAALEGAGGERVGRI